MTRAEAAKVLQEADMEYAHRYDESVGKLLMYPFLRELVDDMFR